MAIDQRGGLSETRRPTKGTFNLVDGHCTYRGVAEAFGLGYTAPEEFLG